MPLGGDTCCLERAMRVCEGRRVPPELSAWLRTLSTTYGERPAVIGEHETLSFASLDRAADRWAAALTAAGCTSGQHVGLLAGNGPEWLAIAFGVWRSGATLVPISTFVTARELEEVLSHADVNLLVVQPQLRSHDYAKLLAQVSRPAGLRDIVILHDGAPAAYRSRADFLASGMSSRGSVAAAPAAVACMLYTSGTTGTPKGVMLSHRAILATVLPTAARSGLHAEDSLLSSLPLFWVAGLAIRALPTLASGCALLLLEAFSVDGALTVLDRHRPTALHLRPPQVGQLLAHPRFRPELLANVRKGGGRAEWYAPHLAEARLITGYGMTEMAGYVTALDWRDSPAAPHTSLGTPLPGVELRIRDPQGRSRAADAVGEICIRGPGMFSGYYKQPSDTGLADVGFYLSGDLGRIDAAGALHFTGRSRDLLRVKGINVSPLEIDGVLATHPDVEAAYVVGIPPDASEQRLVALIVAKPGAQLTAAALHAYAAQALSHYKCPAQYVFISREDVPLGPTSKPQRTILMDLARRRMSP